MFIFHFVLISLLLCMTCYGCECQPGETCVDIPATGHSPGVSICISGETPPNTADDESGNFVVHTTPLDRIETTTENKQHNYNVCDSNSVNRSEFEKRCSNGWKCIYGVCRMDENESVRCDCDAGAVGQVCQDKCCKNCVFGSCFYYKEENIEVCNCWANYSGEFCDVFIEHSTYAPPKEVTWHYWVVGACALVLVILITLMVVVPYILWRNRVILVMKVVHYFQGYEDDDDRQWDAFISYKSNKADEIFVVKTLFPKLEKDLGFKVNVHFRDFVPGETIANNIISAVQGSRRTILVITPSYVTSEFTKFEYQVAQQEMLKRKHRIIPILLEDISEVKETMDPNLKVILNSVTYIEWPKCGTEKKLEKFWKRLELSMPKMKNRLVESNNVSSLTNGHVIMSKPEAISISFVDNKGKIGNGNFSGVYNTIDDNIADTEVEYDTLNDSEMESKVLRQKSISEPKEYVNAIKIDL